MRCLVIFNPYSGTQKINKNLRFIKDTLKTKYSEVVFYHSHGEKSITEYLSMHANDYDLIVLSGGDGTMNEAMTGMIQAKSFTPISYIPAGTCNDFGNMLELKQSLKKSLDLALNGEVVSIDCVKANDKFFIYACGCGKYTDVSYKAPRITKRIFHKMAYFIDAVRQFGKESKMNLEFKSEKDSFTGVYYVMLGLNSCRIAGFDLFRKNKLKLDNGYIDITLIEKNLGGLTWPRLALFFLFGDKKKVGVKTIRCKKCQIKADEMVNLNCDGEFAMSTDEINIEVIPKALNIIVSHKIKKEYFTS
jgi:YegS/Rv2252/BmrU family lipid kinase